MTLALATDFRPAADPRGQLLRNYDNARRDLLSGAVRSERLMRGDEIKALEKIAARYLEAARLTIDDMDDLSHGLQAREPRPDVVRLALFMWEAAGDVLPLTPDAYSLVHAVIELG